MKTIAIVGRPNVGKSTLFNKLIGERRAITNSNPNITRDRIYGKLQNNEHCYHLIDTGGFHINIRDSNKDKILQLVREQVNIAIDEADVLLFVLDAKDGITPVDNEIHSYLRRFNKDILYIINKVDDPKHDERVMEFYQFSTNNIFPISAEHTVGFSDFLDTLCNKYPSLTTQETSTVQTPRICILGRPNVGKSTFANALLNKARLLTDSQPGTTRDAIDFEVKRGDKKYLFIDTAGIRKKGKTTELVEKISIIKARENLRRSDIAIMILNYEEGISKQDAHVIGLIMDEKVGCILLINKSDKMKDKAKDKKKFLEDLDYQMPFIHWSKLLFTSATNKTGFHDIYRIIDRIVENRNRRITTSQLNKAMQSHSFGEDASYIVKHRTHNILFYTQESVNPPTFIIFAHRPENIHFSIKRSIENKIRKNFDFEGTAIRLMFRGRTRDSGTVH